MQKSKEQLKKEARKLNVKVNYRVNGAPRDAPKEVIVSKLLEKKLMQLHPCLTAQLTDDGSSTDSKSLLNDKFRLINVIFSDEL